MLKLEREVIFFLEQLILLCDIVIVNNFYLKIEHEFSISQTGESSLKEY